MSALPEIHSNMKALEEAKAAAHAPRDAATGTGKAIALFIVLLSSAILIVAGGFMDGLLGAFIGFIIAAGIVGVGGTAVWMAENSHKRETEARRRAARERARRQAEQRQQQPSEPAN